MDLLRSLSLLVALAAAVWWLMARTQGFARKASGNLASWRSVTAFYFLVTVASVLLAIGAPGPWQYVYWWPGFNFIRAPSRFMVLGVLGIAVLSGMGFFRATTRLTPRQRAIAALVVAIGLIGEFSPVPYRGVPYTLTIPAADRWVAERPRPFVVAEVPVTWSERYHSNYMLHSMAHWQKTVHGYSGIRPALHEELYQHLRSFPNEEGLSQLARIGVDYLIVHSSWFLPEERGPLEERLASFASRLTLEYRDPDSRVYSLRKPE
jgi:hypothetical protein